MYETVADVVMLHENCAKESCFQAGPAHGIQGQKGRILPLRVLKPDEITAQLEHSAEFHPLTHSRVPTHYLLIIVILKHTIVTL